MGLSISLSASALTVSDDFQIDGFARVIAGYLDGADDHYFNGYNDEVTLQQESLFALQPTYSFNDSVSFTGQFIARSDDDSDSGTEWFYLSYQPDSAWHFRAGKLRMPFFSYSDSLDVGYSYPWITPPSQIYRYYLFSTFKGVSGSYNVATQQLAINIEAYYGYYHGDIRYAGASFDVDGQIDNLRGLVLRLQKDNAGLRVSYHTGNNRSTLYELVGLERALREAGFDASARSVDSHGAVNYLEAALTYDTLSSFYKAEWVHTSSDFQAAPELTGYYLNAGYIFGDWTLHGTYSSYHYSDTSAETELQDLLNSGAVPDTSPAYAQLSNLSYGYNLLFSAVPDGSLDSYTIGLRWDFAVNMALKADVTYVEETAPRSGFFTDPSTILYTEGSVTKKYDAMLYQMGWEWIF
tara:strand:+ start:534 stop:1760 length:1227 start_codon:yes stop_codon:yes gene_type:complete